MKIGNLDLTASDIATTCHAFKLQYTNTSVSRFIMYLSGQDNPIWPAQDFPRWPHEKSPLFVHYNESFIDQQGCSLKMVRFFSSFIVAFLLTWSTWPIFSHLTYNAHSLGNKVIWREQIRKISITRSYRELLKNRSSVRVRSVFCKPTIAIKNLVKTQPLNEWDIRQKKVMKHK